MSRGRGCLRRRGRGRDLGRGDGHGRGRDLGRGDGHGRAEWRDAKI